MNIPFSDHLYFDWRAPNELARLNGEHRNLLGNRAMSGAGQSYRDAHVASRFAHFREADRVRLLEPRLGKATPDLALLFGETEQRFEITEADRPGRRRTAEYRRDFAVKGARLLEDDEWTTANDYKAVIEAIVRKKCAKHYDSCHGLIVWSNAFGIKDDEAMTAEWWSEACASGLGCFQEIWVHHQDAFEKVMKV